jgi:hypothetical protein
MITARKHGGDDRASWAVFIDGRVYVSGLERHEVAYYKRMAQETVMKQNDEKDDSSWNVPEEFVGVRAWGRYLGSFDYYIEQEQRRAVRTQAPIDALYYDDKKKAWVCVDSLSPTHPFREVYRLAVEARQAQLRG